MVCNRCKTVLKQELEAIGVEIINVELGKVTLKINSEIDLSTIKKIVDTNGFEVILDDNELILEEIKIALILLLDKSNDESLSSYLTKKIGREYSSLSKLFSKKEGITIEKYFINLKIEKAKEFIQMGNLNFSEIAYSLSYKNSSHLAQQFKTITGMSMSDYKNIKNWERKPFDQII